MIEKKEFVEYQILQQVKLVSGYRKWFKVYSGRSLKVARETFWFYSEKLGTSADLALVKKTETSISPHE